MTDQVNSAVSVAALCASAAVSADRALDSRRPLLLDHHGNVLQVIAGHADIFAVDVKDGKWGSRHHLFRIEAGDIVPDLPSVVASSANGLCFIATGTEGARVSLIRRSELQSMDLAIRWIEQLARFVAGSAPRWQMTELPEGEAELDAGEGRRGPMRGLVWLTVKRGAVRLMGVGAPCVAGGHPLPLTSALWVEAVGERCAVSTTGQRPADDQIWMSIDQFHPRVVECVQDILAREAQSAVDASLIERSLRKPGRWRPSSPFRHHREAIRQRGGRRISVRPAGRRLSDRRKRDACADNDLWPDRRRSARSGCVISNRSRRPIADTSGDASPGMVGIGCRSAGRLAR